jgi:hypothetical protein
LTNEKEGFKMRRAVILCAAALAVGSAYAESVAFDFMTGAWAVERYRGSLGYSPRGGLFVTADFRLPRDTVAYEATFNYRSYNGVQTDGSVLGLENAFPIYFTGSPLRVYAAPSLGVWRFKYDDGGPSGYVGGDPEFAFSLGGYLGLRVAAGGEGSYLDISYGYQGTKVTGPSDFFASRRILKAKGSIGITSHVGFGIEAGTVEEGWSFVDVDTQVREALSTYYAGSPYVTIGPRFWF